MIIGRETTPYCSETSEHIFHIMKECFITKQYNAEYLKLVEEINTEKLKGIREEMEGYIRASDPDDHYDIYDSFRQDIEQHRDHNPEFLYESLYTGIYTRFEDALREIGRAFYHDYEGKVVPNYKINIIEKYYQIIKHFGNLSPLVPLWKKVESFQKHRNDIAHRKPKRKATTKEMVVEVNTLFCDVIYGIWNNIDIPETPPNRSIIPPADKRSGHRKRKRAK